jgi:hypothetical protein
MTRPNLAAAEQAISHARQHLVKAGDAPNPAARREAYRQAASRLAYAARVLEGLGADPETVRTGVSLSTGAQDRQVPA